MSTFAVLLKESWSLIEDQADELVNNLYARLFLAQPDLRELFPIEMAQQRRRMVDAIVYVINAIDDPERFDSYLRDLGRRHRRYLVQPEHYVAVGQALLGALRQYGGPLWSVEHDQAWRDAYRAMAARMCVGAEESAQTPPYWHAEVLAHERRGRDLAVFRCRPIAWYEYHSGQYACIESPYHPRTWRPYSIANAPRADGTLDFHVRAPSDGWVSATLVRRLRPGDMLRLSPPRGALRVDPYSTRDVVCVAGGTGVAPVRAIVEELVRHNRSRWVYVFVGARTRRDLYDLPALKTLAARYPWMSLVPACSDDPTYPGERGMIDEVMQRYGPWPDHDVVVCGKPAMVRDTLGTLSRLGVPASRVQYDAIPG